MQRIADWVEPIGIFLENAVDAIQRVPDVIFGSDMSSGRRWLEVFLVVLLVVYLLGEVDVY